MKKRKNTLSNKSGRVHELSQKQIDKMRSAKEALPKTLAKIISEQKPGRRGPQKNPTKISITLRYSRDVIDYFKSTGQGWQTKMDDALKDWVEKHRRA